MPGSPAPDKLTPDEPPPILGSWRRLYIAVVVYMALLIAAFHAFTRTYAP